MRKKILAVAMCVCLGMTIFGCGKASDSKEDSKETTSSSNKTTAEPSEPAYTEDDLVDDTAAELNVLDYVELADYIGIDLTKEVTEVTDEDVQSQMESDALELTAEDVTVAEGDIAVIDFVGKLDGTAFDGGTGSNYELEIGSNSFIDGFEDGLIGVKKGETVDLNLTFPESYPSTELAGKDVVFTVTVKSVKRKPAELTDEWMAGNTTYASLDAYKAEVRAQLEADAEDEAQYKVEASALDTVVSNSNIKKYFKSLVEDGESQYENYVKTYASYYGMELSEFIEAQGMTEEDYANTKSQQGASYAEVAMVVQAIAKDAGLTADDEKYQTLLNDLAAQYNMDANTFNSTYGEDVVGVSVMSDYVMQHIVSNANVTTKTISVNEETNASEEQ